MGGGGFLGSLFGGGGKSAPKIKPAPVVDQSAMNRQAEEEEAKSIEENREEARLAALQEKGRDGTILTGSLGATGNAKVRTKTLLGQ